jgi:hypothetical protein
LASLGVWNLVPLALPTWPRSVQCSEEYTVELGTKAVEVAEIAGKHGVSVENDVRMQLRRTMVKKEVGVEMGEEPEPFCLPECREGQKETS